MIGWITACSTAKCTRGELVVDELEAAHGLCHRMHGQPGGTRTPDLLLRRQLLYPVELRAVMEAPPALPVQYGAARPIRTRNRRCDRTHRCHHRSRRRWWQDPGCYGETGRTSCPDMSAPLCRALHDTPRNGGKCRQEELVGAERFELPTLWSQTRCATRLRYAPRRWAL